MEAPRQLVGKFGVIYGGQFLVDVKREATIQILAVKWGLPAKPQKEKIQNVSQPRIGGASGCSEGVSTAPLTPPRSGSTQLGVHRLQGVGEVLLAAADEGHLRSLARGAGEGGKEKKQVKRKEER